MASAGIDTTGSRRGLLFLSDDFPLDCFVIVWPSACWTQAIHVRPDIVEAKLTNLNWTSALQPLMQQEEVCVCIPGIHKDMAESSDRRDRTPRCRAGWCVH